MTPVIRVLTAAFLLLTLVASAQSNQDPVLIYADDAKYPSLAKQAHIEGDVEVQFRIDRHGMTQDVEAISGHPMLLQAAVDNVRTWKFRVPSSPKILTTTFQFTLSDPHEAFDYGTRTERHGFSLVDVKATPSVLDGGIPRALACPTAKVSIPTKETSSDYLELSRGDYTVRVGATGSVTWKGRSSTGSIETHSFQVSSQQARGLLDLFNTEQFWNLCGEYNYTNKHTAILVLHVGSASKRVADFGRVAPELLPHLEDRIDFLARTHEWRHGDPTVEPLWNISDEYAKPDLPPLLAAARDCDVRKAEHLVQAGESLSETDASGWTALMYAANCDHPLLKQRLLKAGADPNQVSLQGDTALMVPALSGELDADLLRAGANINAQNSRGQTVLMLLAGNGFEYGTLEEALWMGADPTPRDAQGLGALDYFKLANCGQDPIRQFLPNAAALVGEKCAKYSEEDVVERALTAPYHPFTEKRIPHSEPLHE